jgi:hypothetical protein
MNMMQFLSVQYAGLEFPRALIKFNSLKNHCAEGLSRIFPDIDKE